MPPNTGDVKLQGGSDGIKSDDFHGDWITCTHSYKNIHGRDEVYKWRCSDDMKCCGRECCVPVAAGFPLWLIILLVLLALLLLLCCLGYLLYRWWKSRPKKPPPPVIIPAPKPPKPRLVSSASQTDLRETKQQQTEATERPKPPPIEFFPVVVERTPPRPAIQHRVIQTEPPFIPDPMDEIELPRPRPIDISYHSSSELTHEQVPLVSKPEPPEEHRARIIYYRPGVDEVAAY